jgi:hypothetical protein
MARSTSRKFPIPATPDLKETSVRIHACPDLIQSNADLDDLLKKAKDTIIDEKEWPEVHIEQTNIWNSQNYRRRLTRISIGAIEALVFLFYLLGIGIFCRSVGQFVLQTIQIVSP